MRPTTRARCAAALLSLLLGGCGGVVPQASPPASVATTPPPPAPARMPPLSPAQAELIVTGEARQGGVVYGTAPNGTQALTLDGKPVEIAADGRFMLAFDRDAGPQAVLEAVLADRTVRRDLMVAPGNWEIERVDASLTGSATSEEFKALRGPELEQIAAARTVHAMSEGWRQSFIWPVRARISGRFGSQRIYRGTPASYHNGLDIAGGAGTVYVAPADGVVVLAADHPFTLEGNLLIVDHGMGLNSAFLHSARLLVKAGDMVKQGQPLGIIGATGRATGPHLHWGMKWNDARIDPLGLLPPVAPGDLPKGAAGDR